MAVMLAYIFEQFLQSGVTDFSFNERSKVAKVKVISNITNNNDNKYPDNYAKYVKLPEQKHGHLRS